jgi:hypothetical protein
MPTATQTAKPPFSTNIPSRFPAMSDGKQTPSTVQGSENHATLKAVIIDLDGTLVDSNEFHVEAWDRAFRQFGKVFSREALRAQIGSISARIPDAR